MVRVQSAGAAPRGGQARWRWQPVLEQLEDRCLLTCPQSPLEPWCRDDTFGTAGQAFIQPPLVGEAHAVAFQNVNGEQRILLGGWAYDPNAAVRAGPNFALMRLTPDGALDPTFGHNGISLAAFYVNAQPETINAIAIQQAISPVCGDTTTPTDKIVVAGQAYPHDAWVPPSDEVMALMRFCADGRLDTAWGGHNADWWVRQPHPDPAGGVSIDIEESNGVICHDWMRGGEALTLAIEPGTNRIVVGGHGLLLKGEAGGGTADHFVVARLNADGTYDASFGGDDTCHNVGRVFFRGGTDHVDDQVHSLALAPALDDPRQWDVLVAGPDEAPDAGYHQFAVARIDPSGALRPRFGDGGIQHIDFGQDAIAWGLAVGPGNGSIIVGGATCPDGCTGLTPASDFALARLTAAGAVDYRRRVAVDYTNIGYSVALQPQAVGDPRIVIGGYSAADGGVPYMAGVRVAYDGTGTPEVFRSDFDTPSVSPGDQAWQVRVQDDNKIVVGGWHTQANGPGFGVMRLCPDPDRSGWSGSADNGSASLAPDVVSVDPAAAPDVASVLDSLFSVLAVPDSPAVPLPEVVAAPVSAGPDTSAAEGASVAVSAAPDLVLSPWLTGWGEDPLSREGTAGQWSQG